MVADALAANPDNAIVYINVSNNKIKDKGASALADALACKNIPIRTLILKDIGMTSKGLQQVLQTGLSAKDPKIEILDCSDNALDTAGSDVFAKWIRTHFCDTLKELKLHNCGLDFKAFLAAFEMSKCIVHYYYY